MFYFIYLNYCIIIYIFKYIVIFIKLFYFLDKMIIINFFF